MGASEKTRVVVFGATGSTGRCLVIAGLRQRHEVTAFVRDIGKLRTIFNEDILSRIRVCEGDALDEWAVGQAMSGQNAAVNAAQHPTVPDIFEGICQNIIQQAEKNLLAPQRLWLFGGLPGLDVPHTKTIGSDLPGIPPILRSHKVNYNRLKATSLDWSFMCPGPMTFEPGRYFGESLRVTTGVMPYSVAPWTGWLPRIFHPFIMLRHMGEVTVSYEDVAELVMANLDANGPYSRQRVGVGAPSST